MTDLDAFFAKKASKGKKKGVIKLEEISVQLERRAMEQRDETDDNENKSSVEDISKSRPANEHNEDSEWLAFDDKPNVPVVIKEMADSYVECEDEEKRASAEPARTWKTNSEENAEGDAPLVKSEPAKYVVKAKKETQLDLKSEEMFPSIEKAPEVEQKLKEQEEISRRAKLEERKQQEEREREEKTKRENAYKAPRRTIDGESPRKQMDKERKQLQDTEPTESDTTSNWRDMQRAVPKEEEKDKPLRGISAAHQTNATKSNEGDSNWRTKPTGITSTADSQNSWRTMSKPAATPQPTSQETPAAGGGNVYIPPHLRKRTEQK
ncbi:hypothetical protein niasHS_002323 [Heterodera schachtii]|uniref:Uncharacterized protein n=1 Tax=Heterodera schachtii TaxID=97005 RepID=A0ABD2KK47_HETSC